MIAICVVLYGNKKSFSSIFAKFYMYKEETRVSCYMGSLYISSLRVLRFWIRSYCIYVQIEWRPVDLKLQSIFLGHGRLQVGARKGDCPPWIYHCRSANWPGSCRTFLNVNINPGVPQDPDVVRRHPHSGTLNYLRLKISVTVWAKQVLIQLAIGIYLIFWQITLCTISQQRSFFHVHSLCAWRNILNWPHSMQSSLHLYSGSLVGHLLSNIPQLKNC